MQEQQQYETMTATALKTPQAPPARHQGSRPHCRTIHPLDDKVLGVGGPGKVDGKALPAAMLHGLLKGVHRGLQRGPGRAGQCQTRDAGAWHPQDTRPAWPGAACLPVRGLPWAPQRTTRQPPQGIRHFRRTSHSRRKSYGTGRSSCTQPAPFLATLQLFGRAAHGRLAGAAGQQKKGAAAGRRAYTQDVASCIAADAGSISMLQLLGSWSRLQSCRCWRASGPTWTRSGPAPEGTALQWQAVAT